MGWLKPGAWLAALSHGHERRLFLGSFIVSLLAGYFLAAMVLFPAPFFVETMAVPDLTGMSRSQAEGALQARGLVAGDLESVNHPTAPAGSIVWQDPPAGVVVPEGTSIPLSVSRGAQQIPVPDVANYTGDLARVLIESAGLVPIVDSVQTPLPARSE